MQNHVRSAPFLALEAAPYDRDRSRQTACPSEVRLSERTEASPPRAFYAYVNSAESFPPWRPRCGGGGRQQILGPTEMASNSPTPTEELAQKEGNRLRDPAD